MSLIYRIFLFYVHLVTKIPALHKLHIKFCYFALILIARLSHYPSLERYFSANSFIFRGFVHVLNVFNSSMIPSNVKNFSPTTKITSNFTGEKKRKYFLKNFINYPPEVIDPEIHLLDWAVQNKDFAGLYFAWTFNLTSFRYYTSIEEGEFHINYLCRLLEKLCAKMEASDQKSQLLIAQNMARFFRGAVNPAVDSDLKEFQIQKMKLLKKCVDVLEPDLKNLPAFSRKPGPLKKVGIMRYSTEITEELIQLRMSFSSRKNQDVEIIWLVLNSNGEIYESRDEDGRTIYHLPLNNFAKTVEMIRSLNLDIFVLGTPMSGKFYNEAAIVAQRRLAPVQLAMVVNVISTGLDTIDAFVCGDIFDAKVIQPQLIEKIWASPECGSREHLTPGAINLPRAWFESDCVHFVSSAHALKLGPEILSVWMKVLSRSPKSKLFLMPFGNLTARSYRDIFLRTLHANCAAHNVAKDRIVILENVVGTKAVIEGLKHGHIYLDTFPYSSFTSLYDPLSIAQPVITLDHPYLRGMIGAGLLRHTGRTKYITNSEAEYIDLAVSLSQNKTLLLKAHNAALEAQYAVRNLLNKDLEERTFEYLHRQYEESRAHI